MEQPTQKKFYEIPEEVLLNLFKFLGQLPWSQANPHIKAIEMTAKEVIKPTDESTTKGQ